MNTTAIVIAGAGARGAYEAGVLSVLVPRLVAQNRGGRILVVGTSAGAINAALLAAVADPQGSVENAVRVWTSVGASDVFAGLRLTAVRDAGSYLGEVLIHHRGLQSLLDSTPLRRTVATGLNWNDLRANLDDGVGWVGGAGVVTTSFDSGRTVVFLQGKDLRSPPADEVRGIDYVRADLAVPHVLASAAIPLAFRPVRIEQEGVIGWYLDGGLRLNAPIRPALDLGADRVVVVATTPDPDNPQTAPASVVRPDVFDAAGVALKAALVDRMAEDVRSLRRTNALVAAGATAVAQRTGKPYRLVEHLFLGPPDAAAIRETANEVFRARYGSFRSRFSDVGTLGRLIGGSTESHGELLSFLFFDPRFHGALIELGQANAQATLGAGPNLPWRT